jgi:hypothetical protein
LPELGCNDDIPKFGERPIGDFPESMPLDKERKAKAKAKAKAKE